MPEIISARTSYSFHFRDENKISGITLCSKSNPIFALFGVPTKQGKAYFQSLCDCFFGRARGWWDTNLGAVNKTTLSTYLFFIP
jgi:hypothetical protein